PPSLVRARTLAGSAAGGTPSNVTSARAPHAAFAARVTCARSGNTTTLVTTGADASSNKEIIALIRGLRLLNGSLMHLLMQPPSLGPAHRVHERDHALP